MAVTVEDPARAALAGRREAALLEEPSVLAVARLLTARCRSPEPWVRAAIGTLDRFAREVAGGDLATLLAAGRADPGLATGSLERLADRHRHLDGGQLAALGFGPVLWWTAAAVPVPWRPLGPPATVRPLPGAGPGSDVRLLLLAVIGSGTTQAELLAVRMRDAGRLDGAGRLVPDADAEPLAVEYSPTDGGPRRLTFLSTEAAAAVRAAQRGDVGPDDPLLLPADAAERAAPAAQAASAALIAAGNDVNVTLCRATGDFFRAWGMPGARFSGG